jgi:hypothetical protein
LKFNTNLILVISFIALSIWLSFSVKKAHENLFQSETQVKELERELGIRKYQLEIMHEALALNIGKAPIPTRQTTLSRQTSNYTPSGAGKAGLMSILYLKAHACSPCNMQVIEGLINVAADNDNFQIASHNSNRHFLQPVIQHNNLAESERVNWLTSNLREAPKFNSSIKTPGTHTIYLESF